MRFSYYIILLFFLGLGMGVCSAMEKNEEDAGFINYVLSRPELSVGQYSVEKIDFEPQSAASTKTLYRLIKVGKRLIVKELFLQGKKEIDALSQVQSYFEKHPLKEPAPAVILPLFTGCYEGEGIKRYFIVLPEAAGISFEALLNQYLSDNITYEEVMSCVSQLGKSVAALHAQGLVDSKECKTRFVHRDLHGGNVFCNQGSFISLIDNEYMALSIEDLTSIAFDLKTILLQLTHLQFVFVVDTKMISEEQRTGTMGLIKAFLRNYMKNTNSDCYEIIYKAVRESAEKIHAKFMEQGIPVVSSCEKEAIIQQLLADLKD